MGSMVQLRDDCGTAELSALARRSRDRRQLRRLLVLAAVYDGMSRPAPTAQRWSCAGFVECYGFGRAGGRRFLS